MPTSAATIDNAASRTASTAFGIQRDDSGQGTSPYDVRSIIDAIYINTGVVKGLEVTGGSDLTYTVAPGTAVCSKADADGKTLAPWHGGKTPAVNAGDPPTRASTSSGSSPTTSSRTETPTTLSP